MDLDSYHELREDGALLEDTRSSTSSEPDDERKACHYALKNKVQSFTTAFKITLFLCAVSIVLFIGFISYIWIRHILPPLLRNIDESEQGKENDLPWSSSEPYPDHLTSTIPPSEHFDLKKTSFAISSNPKTREYVFNITRESGAPDGVSKSMILVNGQSPGPLIEANSGDTIRVIVQNFMDDETTIHWHGLDQKDTVWMDGVHGVTQCGIPPRESFLYQFVISDQRGSFWYHAHVSVQYTDGLYGPLVRYH